MKILLASSEVDPFAKTGGLADVVGALPAHLSDAGHEAVVFMPAYPSVFQTEVDFNDLGIELQIPLGDSLAIGRVLEGKIPGSDVSIFCVRNEQYFDRLSLYGEEGFDYPDNCERFIFFCRAVLECIRQLDFKPDLIHANDWQTGLIPALSLIHI